MKLTNLQQGVITKMKEGWELGFADMTRNDGRAWLQENGLCRGGRTINVNGNTINSLIKKKTIRQIEKKPGDKFWLARFELTMGR